MLKRNSKSYKTILTLIVTFFISGYQLAISNTLINLHDENICKSEDNFNKNNLKCLSHCILDINSDCNPESLFYVTKLDKFVFNPVIYFFVTFGFYFYNVKIYRGFFHYFKKI